MESEDNQLTGLEIAVIGISLRFPGAKDIHEFWNNLINGIESISFFSDEELKTSGVPEEWLEDANYIKAKGVIGNAECFDASFFDYSPREAEIMDPQTRLSHECVWEALENAAYNPYSYNGLIGLYVGANPHYHWDGLFCSQNFNKPSDFFASFQFYDKDFLSMRISYKLNLKGTSFTLYTACSSSLAAIHLACNGILSGECDMALGGGVSIWMPEKNGYLCEEGMILSQDGHNRTFDEKASGSIFCDGIGFVVLKRLENALADRDTIYAVVKGSSLNNDGNRKLGFTAPSVEGLVEVIRNAQEMAEVTPESISYLEAHGTATPLGDTVEMEALNQVFATLNGQKYCGIGSVKSNLGHLNSAAGVAGFIKTVLSLKHRLIPPSLHFQNPNPKIDFETGPFYVNTSSKEWKSDTYPVRAGVNSLGIGGTNAHVILEEPPHPEQSVEGRKWKLLMLSAKSKNSLEKATENLQQFLQENPGINISDTAYTLQVGRRHFRCRKMVACTDVNEASEILFSQRSGKVFTFEGNEQKPTVIFMFPGQGSQYVDMGLGLYREERAFREEMDRCFKIFRSQMGYDIKEILYPDEADRTPAFATPDPQLAVNPDKINRTEISQPAILMLEYALAKLLMSWGIQPEIMIGYSFGEYTAACLAGVFSLEDAIRLVALRGRLMQRMTGGAMLSVPLPAEELQPLLNPQLSIAIDNGPSCVISGTAAAIDAFDQEMKQRRYLCIRVSISHICHSDLLEPILSEFEAEVRKIHLKEPQIPYISNVTAKTIQAHEAADPLYWLKHLKNTVRFGDGVKELFGIPNGIFLEIGPGRDLSVLLKGHKDHNPKQRMINLMRYAKEEVDDLYYLLNKIGHLWLYGVEIDWRGFYVDENRFRIALPCYPFEAQPFRAGNEGFMGNRKNSSEHLLKKRKDVSKWLYIPSWKRSRLPGNAEMFAEASQMHVLVFMDECGLGSKIAAKLRQQGYAVSLVRIGETFTRLQEDEYCIHPSKTQDYDALFKQLKTSGKLTSSFSILHFWSVTPTNADTDERLGLEWVEKEQENGFHSLISLALALAAQNPSTHFQIKVVTNNVQDVIGGEVMYPGKATITGPVKVITQEFSNMNCSMIDIVIPPPGSPEEQELVNLLTKEFLVKIQEQMIAYRNNYRWTQTLEPIEIQAPLESSAAEKVRVLTGLREKGVYLITGGVGGIGLILAEYLARSVQVKLILTGRSAFPARDEWHNWLSTHDITDKISMRIRKIREIEALGTEVLVFNADIADIDQTQHVISRAERHFGPINGIIHAAGLPDGALIIRRTREISEQILAPKIRGTLILNRLLKDRELDFFVVCSSMASLLPPGGQTAYAAANAFLDAFALSKTLTNGKRPISIDWDRWQNIGIAVILEKQHKELWGEELEEGIKPCEGMEVFSRILADPLPQVAVCPIDLSQAFHDYNRSRRLPFAEALKADTPPKALGQRPELSVAYVEPGNETEQKLVEVWQNFLGIDRVGIHDNFFELGATSLGIIQVNGRLKDVYANDISVVTMYSYPTVATLAKFLAHENGDEERANNEKYSFAAINKGQEKMKNLRARRRME